MELIDTHCHLDMAPFDADRGEVLAACRVAGISRIVIPAVHAAGWDNLLQLCQRQDGLFAALGLHPLFVEQHQDTDLVRLARKLKTVRPLAVGEIGLDFYREDLDRERQYQLFEAQLRIAREVDLPVLLHVRKAHDEVLARLRKIKVKGGIAHAFNGSLQQAEQYIELGFRLGFGGTLTYERASKIRQLAAALPLQALVLETDAPDMVVAVHRGERNSPVYLTHVLDALAQLRQLPVAEVAAQTTRNACEVLGLD